MKDALDQRDRPRTVFEPRTALRWLASMFIVLILTAPAASQCAQPGSIANEARLPRSGPTDPAEVEQWLNQFLADYVKRPSASLGFVLVKDGEILFQKGYGYADSSRSAPVVADQTMFYAASVSKLVTATAVMQLLESGKLAADADVNVYLKRFQLEKKYNRPVTVASLLTHTSGLDESFIAGSVDRASDLVSLDDFFAHHPPRRARAPAEQIVYSNMGMAFAGYLVEAVTGAPFHDYVEQNIFRPLRMEHSTFRRPVPARLVPYVATMGVAGQGPDKTVIQLYPSESLVSTVTDMGHFIIAHLNGGRFADAQILSESSLSEMHRRHFTQHPDMPGVAYGFFESCINRRRGLFHTGGGGHESVLYLLPDEHLGFYLVHSGEIQKDFVQAFMDHYYPAEGSSSLPTPPSDFASRENRFTGLFRPNFIARTNIEKLVGLVADTHVVTNGDGTLTIELPPFRSKRVRMVEVEPLLFRGEGGMYIAFRQERNGKVTRMFTAGSMKDPAAYDRIRWYESGLLNAVLALAGYLLFLSFPIVLLIRFFATRRRRMVSLQQHEKRRSPLVWWTAVLVSTLVILSPFPVLSWMLFGDHSRPSQFRLAFHISSTVLQLALLCGPVLLISTSMAWKRRDWTTGWLVYFSLLAFAALCMIPFVYYWIPMRV